MIDAPALTQTNEAMTQSTPNRAHLKVDHSRWITAAAIMAP